MRVLLLTDIHGEYEKLERILSREEYDVVLCAGDLGDAREFSDYGANLEKVLDTFDRKGKMVKAVPGNMDPEEESLQQLVDYRMNIHRNIASFDAFDVVGYGGGQTPFGTPFEPEGSDIKNAVELLEERMKNDTHVAVIHQPPENTELDVADGSHVGSKKVRELIEESGFDLMLTGHIHESWGKDSLGDTELVNPGPVAEGRYGVAEIGEEIEVELKQI